MTDYGCWYEATPHSVLIKNLMDPNIPKTQMEHAACREIEMLREALRPSAQPEVALQYPQDAVEWQKQQQLRAQQINAQSSGYAPRPWVGLTDEEIKRIGKLDWDDNYVGLWYDFAKAIETKLRERNT